MQQSIVVCQAPAARACVSARSCQRQPAASRAVFSAQPFAAAGLHRTRQALAAPAQAANNDIDLLAEAAAVDPEDARGAIAIGLKFSGAGQWERAQQYFERALELPGTGLKRFRDKPRQLSPGELQAALYNVACCRSRLGDVENGLIAIAGAVEQGYRDFAQLRSDPDLEALRADQRFEGLMRRFERKPQSGGFLGLF